MGEETTIDRASLYRRAFALLKRAQFLLDAAYADHCEKAGI